MSVPAEAMGLDLEQQQEAEAEQARRLEMLVNAIDAAEETAYGSDEKGELARERGLSIDFYLGKNVEPGPEGRSQVNDRSVFETIQWILPSLVRIYAGGGNVVELEPLSPEDEAAAQQESDYLNYVVTQKNRWFDLLHAWFQDALLTKNAYVLVYIDEYQTIETEEYQNQSEEQVAFLLSEEGVEVLQHTATIDQSQPPQPVMDPIYGPVLMPVTLHNIVIKRTKPNAKLCFRVLPPERVKASEHTPSHSLDECPYFEYWENKTLSEVRQMGFDVPDDVPADAVADSEEDTARNRYQEQTDDSNPVDPSLRRVKLRTIWIQHDTDGDGLAERQRVIRLGKQILFLKHESRIPVSCIVPYILTHRHIGMSVTDIVLDIQRQMTAIWRQGLDNLYQSNNVRWAHSREVNLDDLLETKPGGSVEVNGSPAEHLMPMVPPFLFPQAIEGLEYMDAVKEKRTGVNRTFAGVDEKALHNPSSGTAINQLSTMAAQRVEQIARVFAPGIEYLFSIAHELLLKHGHKKEVVKLRGKWVEVDPSTWRTGRDMRITVGFGAGNKDAMVARLMNILTIQKEAMAGGLRIASEKDVYDAASALVKASDFTTTRFFTDPETLPPPEPPPPSQDQIWQQVEMAKLASNERISIAKLQAEMQGLTAEQFLERWKVAAEAQAAIAIERVKGEERIQLEKAKPKPVASSQ